MRLIPFALATCAILASEVPSRAQWWGGPGGRAHCFADCGPPMDGGWAGGGGRWRWRRLSADGVVARPFWGADGPFEARRFGWWERPTAWRRIVRLRRFEAWRRWAAVSTSRPRSDDGGATRPGHSPWHRPARRDAGAHAALAVAPPVRMPASPHRVWRASVHSPDADKAVAFVPAAAIRLPIVRPHPALGTRVLASAAALHPAPPSRPFSPSSVPGVHPAALRSQPAAATQSAEPVKQTSGATSAPTGDVPVAPLD